jgi:hypothetical protein
MLSWRPMSAANKHRAKLPENPANIVLSGQNGLLINGWAVVQRASFALSTNHFGFDYPSMGL